MIYTFSFKEINYGSIEIEADHRPDESEVTDANSVFRGMLYHTRKNNYTKQSIFKIKESDYHVHLFTAAEIYHQCGRGLRTD